MTETGQLIPCQGCGAPVPDTGGPTHAYIGASPGCWAIYGQVLAREYGEFGYPPVHRLTVDAYAAQHPGEPSPQAIRSVAGHLINLFLTLEKGYALRQITAAMGKRRADDFVWLDPPATRGDVTVVDVQRAKDLAEHEDLINRWARSVWAAWSPHHETIRRWAGS